jgi:two-component system cell cycle sensor histidine kinase/response regulator CckA
MAADDQTSRRFATIEDARAFLEGLFFHAPVGFAVFDVAGHCVVVNDEFRALFGSQPPPEYNIHHDEIAAELGVLAMLQRSFEGETVSTPTFWYDPRELRSVHVAEGRRVAISMTTFPLRGPDGRVAHVVATYRDQTAEAQAREAVEAERDHFKALFHSALDGIVLVDDAGVVLEINPAACAALDRGPADVLGRGWTELWGAGTELGALWERLGGGARTTGEAAVLARDGSPRTIEYVVVRHSQPGRHLVNFRDVSGRRQLERSQRMEAVGRLAGGVAHDFNNLLTVINGYADLVARNAALGERDVRRLHEIRQAGQWATRLTRQLLSFSRQSIVAPAPTDLNAVVREMEEMLRRLIGEDVRLSVTLEPQLSPVLADRSQIEQVLMNLAVNARDAMPQGGALTVETRELRLDAPYTERHTEIPPGAYVMLAVSDTGVGMDEDTRGRIFEPFFTTKEGRGTGLGLSTVAAIVRQSNGHVVVYSEVGHGTSFKVYLPRAAGAAAGALAAAPAQERGTETVLLVEDERGVREYVRELLEENGYRVLEAGNGTDAIALCDAYVGAIDLLLTDVVLPDLGGSRLTEALTALRPDLRVLYMSGYADDAVVRHGILQGSVAFIEKPFSSEALAAKMREVLARPPTR